MSISNTIKAPEGISREKVIKTAYIKRVVDKTAVLLSNDPINFMLIIGFLTTAIGELSGRQLSWKWFTLLTILILIFFINKFDLLKKEKDGIINKGEVIKSSKEI